MKAEHILYVCVHNAGRSQMAEAITRHYAKQLNLDWIETSSAGTVGGKAINPMAAQALTELGISTDDLQPKLLTQEMVQNATIIVSMGCGVDAEACPAKFIVTEDWGLDDPAGQPIEKVREIRDQIVGLVKDKLQTLTNVSV